MRFQGKLTKVGRWWAAEVSILGVHTQGRTKAEAYLMVADAIEALVDKSGFKAMVYPGTSGYFEVGANDDSALMAFMLRQRRAIAGISLADAAKRMGAKSRNAYARYEQGSSTPTIDSLSALMSAVGGLAVVISESTLGKEKHPKNRRSSSGSRSARV